MKKLIMLGVLLLALFSLNAVADTCSSTYSLIRGETVEVISGTSTVLSEINIGDTFMLGSTRLQYKGADKITKTNPEIKFKNFETGDTLTYTYQILESEPPQVSFSIKLHGESYPFRSFSDVTRDDFTIRELSDRAFSDTSKEVTLTAVEFSHILERYQVKFSVNGEDTNVLGEKESYILADGSKITVSDILYQAYVGGVHSASFCFDGEAQIVEEEEPPVEEEPERTSPVTLEADLANYPQLFVKDGKLNAFLVVGWNAPAIDNLALNDIAVTLDREGIDVSDRTRLESEIVTPLNNNLIVVGKPEDNTIANLLMSRTSVVLNEGEGMIKLFENSGYVQMLVTGYSTDDTRKAAKVLQNYDDYDLEGKEVIITGSMSNPQVQESAQPVVEPEEPEAEEEEEEPQPQPAEPTPEVEEPQEAECTAGCQVNGNCLPYGTRLVKDGEQVYCSIDGTLQEQQELNGFCQNNYECSSNQCSNAKCIDLSGQIEEAKSVLEKIFDWLKSIFG